MKALRWHAAGDLRLEQLQIRPPGADEVQLQVAYCGICGSDLHEFSDGPHTIACGAAHVLSGRCAPVILGHEFCGTVSEVGHAVTTVAVGDHVAVEPIYRCGRCRCCRQGQYNLCTVMGFAGLIGDGGFAEYATVPSYMVHRLPPSVSLRNAALLEPAAVAMHALRQGDAGPGRPVAVVGLGPVGLLLVVMLRLSGVDEITAVDLNADHLAMAGRLGATTLVDASDAAQLEVMAGARKIACVFEAAGSAASFVLALKCLRKGGELVQVGLMGEVPLDVQHLVDHQLRISGSVGYCGLYPRLIDLMASGHLCLESLITAEFCLDDALLAFASLRQDRDQIKVLITPAIRGQNR